MGVHWRRGRLGRADDLAEQTRFLSGKQLDGNDIYGYVDVMKPGGGFSWYFFASRSLAYAKSTDSPAWLARCLQQCHRRVGHGW